jgi:arylsulfatase A-like enzyme
VPPPRPLRGTALTQRPPDIVILVLDTVRQAESPGGSAAIRGLPTLERLLRESVAFPQAFAPAPWTVPSHASLLTGLAPWQHGMHARGHTRLASTLPTIPSELRPLGYRSVCLSSNPYLGSSYGLTDEFDEAFWGGWHEPFLRGLSTRPQTRPDASARASTFGLSFRQLTDAMANEFQRHPGGWDRLLRVARRVGPGETVDGSVSGWIEPALDGFLARQPRDRPILSLINLMDAHEPYIGVPGVDGGFRTPRQDRAGWVRGTWEPDPRDLAGLREAYERTYPILDQRVSRIAEAFRSHDRWENSVVIVTSDHGQAFGEHGILYHGLRTDEPLLRVPLMVRWPGGADAGRVRAERVSIAAIHDLALDAAAHRAPPWDPDGRGPRPPSGIPTAIADGLLTAPGRQIPESRRRLLDRTFVAAYDGSRKVTLDVQSGRRTEHDLDRDPLERAPGVEAASNPSDRLQRHLENVAREAFGGGSPGVADRLASWGYL